MVGSPAGCGEFLGGEGELESQTGKAGDALPLNLGGSRLDLGGRRVRRNWAVGCPKPLPRGSRLVRPGELAASRLVLVLVSRVIRFTHTLV